MYCVDIVLCLPFSTLQTGTGSKESGGDRTRRVGCGSGGVCSVSI